MFKSRLIPRLFAGVLSLLVLSFGAGTLHAEELEEILEKEKRRSRKR